MRYPEYCKPVIDVTKAPYFADNTGKTDCTAALQKALDDYLTPYVVSIEETRQKLLALYEERKENVYLGAEQARVVNGEVLITMPDCEIPSGIIYFPAGTYLVSDTVCYTLPHLSTRQQVDYTCELCRNIHLLGEDRDTTVIRLQDHTPGFEAGSGKPVVSFTFAFTEGKETTNCAQMNTLEDITVDCGAGNDGAVGVRYASSNCGRIENVTIRTQTGLYGLEFDYGSECCAANVRIEGFDYGVRSTHTSPVVFDGLDVSQNRVAGVYSAGGNMNFKTMAWGEIPAFRFEKGHPGRFFVEDVSVTTIGDATGNYLYTAPEKPLLRQRPWPKNRRSERFDNWVCVDDFGAVGDGKTDSTQAIQAAMNSGKEVILFGKGTYVIERTVKVPATVKTVDFMYCGLLPGYSLIVGEMAAMFDLQETSDEPFFAEHLFTTEKCCGFFHLFRQSAVRTAVFRDLCVAAALYFNTVGGSEVYFDNCFTLTNHYSQNAVLGREGYVPVFCRMIPVELYGQTAYARNLNIERADLELLNDGSDLLVDGYKTEGPGKMVKTVNGGKTQLNLFNSAWWGNRLPENDIFETRDASLMLTGGHVFCYPEQPELRMALRTAKGEEETRTELFDCSIELLGTDALARSLGRLIDQVTVE